jgi:Ser/Thr protein kinase RdoA (MazF antagonist)
MMPIIALSSWVQQHYGLPARPDLSLLRSYTNDVYRVDTGGERYVLKIYGLHWRSEEEIRYEIELLQHLSTGGLTVAQALPGTNEELVKRIESDAGERLAVLFEYAVGEKPEPPFDNSLYFLFGEAIGRMHQLSTDFIGRYRRRKIDLDYLIDNSLEVVLPLFEERSADGGYLLALGKKIKSKIDALSKRGLDWGPIHGDATLDNLHVVGEKQIILYDFDSGGPGWRASDLQGWAIGFPEYQERYAAFLNGYRQVRELKEADIEASWYITLAWDIWGLKVDLEKRVLRLGEDATKLFLAVQMEQIRTRERFLI